MSKLAMIVRPEQSASHSAQGYLTQSGLLDRHTRRCGRLKKAGRIIAINSIKSYGYDTPRFSRATQATVTAAGAPLGLGGQVGVEHHRPAVYCSAKVGRHTVCNKSS